MAIKYCIWDVGQVIYPYSLKPVVEWMRMHTALPEKFPKISFDYDPYMKGQIGFEEVCCALCHFYFVPYQPSYLEEIRNAFWAGVGDFFPQTACLQEKLHRMGIQNGILSNALPVLAGDERLFKFVSKPYCFTSFELGLLKPDSAIYECVRQKLKCRFDEMIFVDDRPENVESAEQLGIHAILFHPEKIQKDLEHILQSTGSC